MTYNAYNEFVRQEYHFDIDTKSLNKARSNALSYSLRNSCLDAHLQDMKPSIPNRPSIMPSLDTSRVSDARKRSEDSNGLHSTQHYSRSSGSTPNSPLQPNSTRSKFAEDTFPHMEDYYQSELWEVSEDEDLGMETKLHRTTGRSHNGSDTKVFKTLNDIKIKFKNPASSSKTKKQAHELL